MKRFLRVLLFLTALSVLSAGIVTAQAPIPPVLFQGEVTIDGNTAPVGTVITAEVDGEEVTTCTIDGVTIKEGQYMLAIPNNGYMGKMVVVKVDGIVAGEHEYISSMDTFAVELNLDVETGSSGSSGLSGFGTGTIVGIVAAVVVVAVVAVLLIRRRKRS